MEVADLNMRAPYFYPTVRMSDEGGVVPSDVVHDTTPQEVTPTCGQRSSGHLAGLGRPRTLSRVNRAIKYGPSPAVNRSREECI